MRLDRITLLKFVSCFGGGGTERQMVNLVRALDPLRFELHLACLRRWGLLDEVESSGAPVVEYKITRLYNHTALREQIKFAQYLRRNRVHIVHTYGFYNNVFAIPPAKLAGAPVIVASIRDTGDLWTPMQRRVQKVICRLADQILVNAETIRQLLIATGYPQEKVTVIPNGIDFSRFARNGNDGRLRHEFDLPPHAPLVAVLSRLHPWKGIEYFLEAAMIVSRRFPEVRFLIVGEGQVVDSPYKRELEGYAVRLGLGERVVFAGFRLDVPEILAEVAVSVLPSLSEGLSNVLLESMAAGAPVVATRVGGNPEVVEDGETGLLVPPRDPAALAQAICRLLDSPELASRFGQAGRERVIKRFSLERMVQATESLYLDLLNRAGHRIGPQPKLYP